MKKLIAVMLSVIVLLSAGYVLAEESEASEWIVAEHPGLDSFDIELFYKAYKTYPYVGVAYEPVVLLGYQKDDGTNYCYLCTATPTYPGARPELVLVYIREDPDGEAGFVNDLIYHFDIDPSAILNK